MFERFLQAERRRPASAEARTLCATEKVFAPIDSGGQITLLETTDRNRVTLICVSTQRPVDLAIQAEAGRVTIGEAQRPRRDWERIHAGQQI